MKRYLFFKPRFAGFSVLKTFLFSFLFLFYVGLSAQVDDFTDGNFSSNPVWSGDTSSFSIYTDAILPSGTASTDGFFLGSKSSIGDATITTPSTEVNEWKFSWGSGTFDPAAANYLGVILMANQAGSIATSGWAGYYLKIGVSGDSDKIELWKKNGGSNVGSKVGEFSSGPTVAIGALKSGLNIRITRSNSGVFTLYYSTGFTYASTPTTSAGTLTDADITTSAYFGIYQIIRDTSTARRNYIDNIVLGRAPIINVSETALTGMNYLFGSGPSAPAKTFSIQGSNLTPTSGNNVVYVMSLGQKFEYSLDDITYTEDYITFPFTGSSFTKLVYARLKSGLAVNSYSDVADIAYYNDSNSPYNIMKTLSLSGSVTAPSASITAGTIAGSPFCVTETMGSSNFNVPFTSTGTFTGNTYTAQLSNASGSFISPVSIGTLVSNANSGTITASIPANTATGTGYRIRVVASNPQTVGSANGSDITINLAKNNITPIAVQNNIEGVNGTALNVNENSTPTSRSWKYSTTSGTGYVLFNPSQTGTSYIPNFTLAGTYYVVCESTFACGTVRSNEVTINVGKPTITITGAPTLFTYPQGQGPSLSQSVTVSGVNLATNITVSVPNSYWEISTNAQFLSPSSSIILTKNSANSVSSTIYVRLKAGLPEGQYNFSTDDDLQAVSTNALTKTVDLDGDVTAPKAELIVRGVFSGGTTSGVIPNGDTTPMTLDNTEFASQNIGDSQTKVFRLENIGGLSLNVSSISLNNPSDFTVTASAPYNIASTSFQDFTITFHPANLGDRVAVVTVSSSDLTDPSYTFTIQGLGKNAEISVTGNGNLIESGSTTISSLDNTLIGIANASTANPTSISKTFVIGNTGNIPLVVSGITIGGVDASQFTVSPSSLSIASNATETMTVTFSPISEGVKNALINIVNNDMTDNENPYTFAIQGNAVAYITCATDASIPLQILALQDFESPAGAPAWPYTNTNGTVTNGTAYADVPNVPKFIDSRSFQVNNTTAQLNFNFDTSDYDDMEFSLRVGAFGSSNSSGLDTNSSDYVRVEISPDNINWYKQVEVSGGNNNARWSFSSGLGIASKVYSASNIYSEFKSAGGGSRTDDGYSTISINNLPKVSNLYFRISINNNANSEIWALDNVTLKGRLSTGVVEKTWDGSLWSGDGLPPTSSQKAIIDGDLTLPYTIGSTTYSSLEACECQINAGKTLMIGTTDNTSKTSTPANAVIQSKIINNGSLILASDSNLQQLNPFAENTFLPTNFVAKRFARLPKMGYTYWSSPVNNQNLYAFSDGGLVDGTPKNRFWQYDEATDNFKNTGAFLLNDSSVFEPAKAYAIRGRNGFSATMPVSSHEFSFTGIPNNGKISFATLKYSGSENGYNLVGNPYPSNIDFDKLYDVNKSRIYATAYFWTNNNMDVTSQQGSSYSGNNYAVYNLTGGAPAVEIDPNQPDNPSVNPTPTNIIKVGQGFIIRAKSGANNQPLDFMNSMRLTDGGVFFNNKSSLTKNRFWLQLKSPSNIVNTILIGYIPNASNDFEIDFDAELFIIGSDSFFSLLNAKKLAIQGRNGNFSNEDVVNLGNVCSQNGTYKISLKTAEGIFDGNQNIYLKDKLLNKVINLNKGDYSFEAVKGTDATRFEIVYKESLVLGNSEIEKSDFAVYRDKDSFVIRSSKALGRVEIYDAGGRLVRQSYSKENKLTFDASDLPTGIYIIKSENSGDVKSKKIVK